MSRYKPKIYKYQSNEISDNENSTQEHDKPLNLPIVKYSLINNESKSRLRLKDFYGTIFKIRT